MLRLWLGAAHGKGGLHFPISCCRSPENWGPSPSQLEPALCLQGSPPSLVLSSLFFTDICPLNLAHLNTSWCLLLACSCACGFSASLSVRAARVTRQEGAALATVHVLFHLVRDPTAARTFRGHGVSHLTWGKGRGQALIWTLLEPLQGQVPHSLLCESTGSQYNLLENSS